MTNQQTQSPRRVRPKPRLVTVEAIERLTPGCIRVTFGGPELEGLTTKGPAEHLKVFFPRPGETAPAIPAWGPDGPMLRDGESMPPSRTYTPRMWRPDSQELVVDFMLHGEGLASDWAVGAEPGDVMAVSGQPGGAWMVDEQADWYLLAADESALPGLATILEALPAGKHARVLVEVKDAQEQQALSSPADIDVTWLYRDDSLPGEQIESAIRSATLPEGDGRVWVGCEAGIMRNIRRHLLEGRMMDRTAIHTHGYWKAGVTNHPDHDVGQDL
jgi:NADPH-dependent ferric siderophore reductase